MSAAPSFLEKIVPRSEAVARAARLAGPVVFTNGVFDVLHRGHVTYLAQARALGGSLVVALNTDASARRLGKGPDRPLNAGADRAIVVAALASVDLVTFFDEDTPVQLLAELRRRGDTPVIMLTALDQDIDKGRQFLVVVDIGRPVHGDHGVGTWVETKLVRFL